ncbi:MAG: multifunctional oxoglutarate decarboxylase/oxoglutarate dehydrogenase thiamine pyrophosphate-binding subunit/dihydrolipoyllysine-residue succinyltransferase subunit [Planctomycetota bacterium]
MTSQFESEYGVNAGYVEGLFEEWMNDPESVDLSWRGLFERHHGGPSPGTAASSPATLATATATKEAPDKAAGKAAAPADDGDYERLSGVAGLIARNMTESLEVPTATSVRTLPAKVLAENRVILNEHLQVRAFGKASFTHIIAFAMAKALGENLRLVASFVERDGKPFRRLPDRVNLGLAIDVPGPKGRMLVVPSIKGADRMGFKQFLDAYETLVARGRDGDLGTPDFAGTNVTLTNPGGFGTEMSVPRLMKGQGLIIATGNIGVPPEVRYASAESLAEIALGPVMTMTSTYDHRIIQGAESALLLKRIDELLNGADGFYDEVFRAVRVPWTPHTAARDLHGAKSDEAALQSGVWSLINAYRVRGCRLADLDPLEYRPEPLPSLDPATYGFTVWDLDRTFLCRGLAGKERLTLREILAHLRRSYCRRWSLEYMHISEFPRKAWIRDSVEMPGAYFDISTAERQRILERLFRAENFERFLHTKYVGNKRFSLEGGDSLIPALAEIIDRAAENGVGKVVIGMAHRGRLNVLVNILGKSHEQVFREFEGVLLPLSAEGTGDVKYHLGQRGTYVTPTGKDVEIVLSANPSHLEAVDPVVCGMTRAYQDAMGDRERRQVLAILVHGDAAFSGQGVVAETLNMSNLRAYGNGGTIHIVVNNQIGFTAGPEDLRSTYYCTDVAKSVGAPILHANGDYPESVVRSVRLATDYQREFGKDVVVDMVCYRRWGHNEGDEPAYTQPVLYAKIRQHPTVAETYTQLLIRRKELAEEDAIAVGQRFDAELADALARSRENNGPEVPADDLIDLDDDDPRDYVTAASPETGLPHERLIEIVEDTNRIPEGHVTHPNLLRQLSRRERMVRGEQGLDWGCAEVLAFGSILGEGVSIRLSGQDSGRGTFSHRHAVIRDQISEKEYVPLRTLATEGADFAAWDSLLSEEAVLGFEYGYALARPAAFVLWEAQFGDFVNGAQIPIDQFIVASESKWRELSGVTLLLPHGYDGQGPEHSSARPERFLGLCSGGNMTVANCSTSAQYFHLMRRQGKQRAKRPLVVLTPKSLLRDKRAASDIQEFTAGGFQEVLDDVRIEPAATRRLVLCSGKLYHELADARDEAGLEDVAIVRLEQLYPLPKERLLAWIEAAEEVVWAQEEPRNMGAWPYMLQRFSDFGLAVPYAGRPESSSPATGSYRRHSAEQTAVIRRALGIE